ncbi:MAG: hypothetical protein K1X35_04445 [Caulobacteraceae bacterium]|nr:hypothetical protein [Caulobacteraceae bacterium]
MKKLLLAFAGLFALAGCATTEPYYPERAPAQTPPPPPPPGPGFAR